MIGNLLGCPDGVLYLFSSIPEGREQEVRAKPRAFVNELRDLYRPTLDDARITKLQVFEAKVGRIKTFQSPPFRAVIYGDAAGVGLFWRGLGYNMCVKTVGAMRQAVAGLVQGEDPEKVLNHYQKRCDRIMDKWDFFHVPRQWLCYKDMLKNPYLVRVPYVIWNSLPERYSISVRSLVKAERGIHQACQRIAEWVPSWNLTAEKVRSSLPEWPEIFSQPS
jgi:hypothetical protein